MKILYISYDALTDFVSGSQVIPYLEGLAKTGHEITLLSFEKIKKWPGGYDAYSRKLKDSGIERLRLKYHKEPAIPATLFDIMQGVFAGIQLSRRRKIEAIHTRGYIAACIGFALKYILRTKVIFDMRGFWADEKVDAGNWSRNGVTYKTVKRLEKIFISRADEIVVLTEEAKRYISENYSVTADIAVIPCCVDTSLFGSDLPGSALDTGKVPGKRVVLYVGNLGSFYNTGKIFSFFSFLKTMDNAFFLRIISGYEKDLLAKTAEANNVREPDYSVERLDHKDMPEAFSAAEISLIFYNRKLSGIGCFPIKFAESLASGVPVIINAGIGDCDRIVTDNRVGAVLKYYSKAEYERAFSMIERFNTERSGVRQRCRETALRLFSLDAGVKKYEDVYGKIRS